MLRDLNSEEMRIINKTISSEVCNLIQDIQIKLGRKLTIEEIDILGEAFVRACWVTRNIFNMFK